MPFDAPETVRWPIRLIVRVHPSKVFKTQIYYNIFVQHIFIVIVVIVASLQFRRKPEHVFRIVFASRDRRLIFFVTYLYASSGADQMIPKHKTISYATQTRIKFMIVIYILRFHMYVLFYII